MYGTEPGRNSFANNCLLARRLAEADVRFIQLYDWGWDMHGTSRDTGLAEGLRDKCREIDRPIAALLADFKTAGSAGRHPRGLGRRVWPVPPCKRIAEAPPTPSSARDHHGDAFTMWMAGGGVRGGASYGVTDAIGYQGVAERTHVHDIQATILHQLGLDHEQLTFPFQGRNFPID